MNRSELKRKYKETDPRMGIYQVKVHNEPGLFIGASPNIDARINRHLAELKLGNNRNPILQNLWNQWGEGGFEFSMVDRLKPIDDSTVDIRSELNLLLEMWVDKLKDKYGRIIRL